jgi:signal transduction histidine kinase
VQAISEGGQITVSMEKGERKNAGYVCFSVSDSGCGIDQEKISKIFDPFFTTKENGTGLGLAIVKRFVESHSGFIDVKSAPGKGTTVKVFLPLLKE